MPNTEQLYISRPVPLIRGAQHGAENRDLLPGIAPLVRGDPFSAKTINQAVLYKYIPSGQSLLSGVPSTEQILKISSISELPGNSGLKHTKQASGNIYILNISGTTQDAITIQHDTMCRLGCEEV